MIFSRFIEDIYQNILGIPFGFDIISKAIEKQNGREQEIGVKITLDILNLFTVSTYIHILIYIEIPSSGSHHFHCAMLQENNTKKSKEENQGFSIKTKFCAKPE